MMEVSERQATDDQATASDEYTLEVCQPCSKNGKQLPPKGYCLDCKHYLCQRCYEAHTIPIPLQQHKLLDSSAMPKLSSSTHGKSSAPSGTITCTNHTDKLVEYYCPSHNTAICGKCAYEDHNHCKAQSIDSMAQNFLSDRQNIKLEQDIDELEKELDKFNEQVSQSIKDAERSSETAEKAIKKFTSDAITHIKKKESELLQTLLEMKSDGVNSMKSIQNETKSLKSKMKNEKAQIKMHSANDNDYFVSSMRSLSSARDIHQKFHEISPKHHSFSYSFQPSKKLADLLDSNDNLGNVSVEEQTIPQKPKLSEDFSALSLSNEEANEKPAITSASPMPSINVKSEEDKFDSCITGVTLLSSNILLLADNNNSRVKCVDISKGSIQSSMTLCEKPWDVTSLPLHQAAVTLPNKKQIEILSISPTLSSLRTITVNFCCKGITSTRDKLIVFDQTSKQKIEVINFYGTVLKTLSINTEGMKRFGWSSEPEYVTLAKEKGMEVIYISDRSKNEITKLTMDGQVLFTYTNVDLKNPRALAVTNEGQLLVCSWFNSKIHLISTAGVKLKTVLRKRDGIYGPYALAVCPHTKSVYISCYGTFSGKQVNNEIKVYKYE